MHKSIHYHLHCLRLIRRSIPLTIDITIASSYIIPLFDYCNSLLFNLPEYKLQLLQNSVISFVHVLPRCSSDSITPLLKNTLAASPLPHKISLTIHKAIHHNSPDYIASLLHLHTPITPLPTRSSNTFIITTPHLQKRYSSNIRSFAPESSLPLTTGTPYPITYELCYHNSYVNKHINSLL